MKPPLTSAERDYLDTEIARYRRTGYGVDPNQDALYHRDGPACRCHFCADTPIAITSRPPQWLQYAQELRLPPLRTPTMFSHV